MESQTKTSIETLMEQISKLPLWVKQVIYAQLRQDLETHFNRSTLDAFGHEDTLQLMPLKLTVQGSRTITERSAAPEMLKLLDMAMQEKNVITMCITNGWSLEDGAIKLQEALDANYVEHPKSSMINATIGYLANKIRLGEYLVQIGRISVEQLDQALQMQGYISQSMGQSTGIANLLINLGYIHKQDSEGILFLKQESKKAFSSL